MNRKLTLSTASLLTVPPLLWAGNAIVGRMVRDAVPPMTLNLLRWTIALLVLVPLGRAAFKPGSGVLANWRRLSMLGLLGIGLYNSLQYLALQSSTPINVTLVASGMPVWMLLVGKLFYKAPVKPKQVGGAVLSILGVLVVLCRGDVHQLAALRLVTGDLYMILATIAWSFYSWMLMQQRDPEHLRADWAAFLLAQVGYGVLWCAALSGLEWTLADVHVAWSWPLAAALLYVAIGPAILAMRCWGAGLQQAGPTLGSFFINLTPLFTALLSSAFLGEAPHLYHALAFGLIVGGIAVSAR
ncbi:MULTISPECIES: DMT family transporter [unclassified Massilia]|uniref:DMT family transporter n=1 Tax=unclassified Massilia TaxID=2609279 RepID=UPI00177CD52B|nr:MULTISPECIES: DMT family transporter [unclassified Massilia]MBD8528501.1 DMT family transporter [Massilia sp. CFBP 13647]MBD8671876.1 DMT family transporter [Massilia sp. CFBP 13721]